MKSILYVAVVVSLLGYALSSEPEDSPKERLIALYRTATYVTVSTSTVSRYYSCITTSSTTACTGRRRRKRKADIMQKIAPETAERQTEQLQGSMIEQPTAVSADTTDARLGFTVWTTSTSWLTLYTTSLNSATTVVITYLCTDSGTSTVPACG